MARENQLAEGFVKQGIAEENYPQFGTNPGYSTTPVLQNQTPTPWNNPATQVTTVPQYDNYLNATQRIRALRNGENLRLHIDENPDWDGQWAKHCWKWVGKYYVDKYNEEIEKYAKKANLDPDKLRAVMFTENACGNYGSANYWADVLGWSDSQMPMNIQGKTWEDFNGKHYDTDIPQQNIELGTKVLKQMQNSLNEPTPDRVGTLWNETGANNINDVGARVKTAYDTKPWLGEKQWEQQLLEFFFRNKRK